MKRRNNALHDIRRQAYDLCIIGAGATGLGCALDAQLRGFSTVLLDAGDFVSRTSMASTKLVHGGVRYLRQALTRLESRQFAMVRGALFERMHMLRNAPFLAYAMEFMVPCYTFASWPTTPRD
jgi:glycerol-3-phosphate dehydrogenase